MRSVESQPSEKTFGAPCLMIGYDEGVHQSIQGTPCFRMTAKMEDMGQCFDEASDGGTGDVIDGSSDNYRHLTQD